LAHWELSGGLARNLTRTQSLTEGCGTDAVVADKAFYADALISTIHRSGCKAMNPPKTDHRVPRTSDQHKYKRAFVDSFNWKTYLSTEHSQLIANSYSVS
jgi:hypothetical protein